ncbi:MAG: hypothetical protein KDC84_05205 [Crocinitomicaceae bacterium]|nr:hypothetical protein [Crocinitomicaceae bacterium]
MKKIGLTFIALASLVLVSCGGEEKSEDKKKDNKEASNEGEENVEAPKEVAMVEMDLSEHGYPLTIMVPEGATFEKGNYNDLIKTADGKFGITIETMDWGKDEALDEAKKNDVNKLKEILEESENGYFIQTEVMGKDDFHMYMSFPAPEDELYIFQNEKGAMRTKAEATTMYESLKSIKQK